VWHRPEYHSPSPSPEVLHVVLKQTWVPRPAGNIRRMDGYPSLQRTVSYPHPRPGRLKLFKRTSVLFSPWAWPLIAKTYSFFSPSYRSSLYFLSSSSSSFGEDEKYTIFMSKFISPQPESPSISAQVDDFTRPSATLSWYGWSKQGNFSPN
jgi:hypothetical protein